MDRHRLIRLACGLTVIAVGQFIVVGAIAIHQYPGGTPFDKTTEGYSFWHNTLSDLGKETAENGQPVGPVAPMFNASMVVMLVGFAPLWLTLPSIFPTRRRLGLIVRLAGLLSLGGIIGVGLTPADQYVWLHALAIICAAVPGIAAVRAMATSNPTAAKTARCLRLPNLVILLLFPYVVLVVRAATASRETRSCAGSRSYLLHERILRKI